MMLNQVHEASVLNISGVLNSKKSHTPNKRSKTPKRGKSRKKTSGKDRLLNDLKKSFKY